MPTLADMRVGLATNLETIQGCQISPYLFASPTLPCLYVYPGDPGTVYDTTMARGFDLWMLNVVALTGAVGDRISQELMDEFLAPHGARSVKEAVERDRTLGGLVDDLRVVSATGYRYLFREGGSTALWAEWTVQLHASGVP